MVRRVVVLLPLTTFPKRKGGGREYKGREDERGSGHLFTSFNSAVRNVMEPPPPTGFLYTQTVDIDFLIESHTATVGPPRLPSATSAAIRNSRSCEDEFGIDGNEREREGGYPVRNWTKVRDYIVVRDYRASILLSQVVLLRDRKDEDPSILHRL